MSLTLKSAINRRFVKKKQSDVINRSTTNLRVRKKSFRAKLLMQLSACSPPDAIRDVRTTELLVWTITEGVRMDNNRQFLPLRLHPLVYQVKSMFQTCRRLAMSSFFDRQVGEPVENMVSTSLRRDKLIKYIHCESKTYANVFIFLSRVGQF